MVISNREYGDLSGTDLSHEFRECVFHELRGTNVSESKFLSCDFRNAKLLNTVFKLSCTQGANNLLNDAQVVMFLFWLLHVFDISPEMKRGLIDIIGEKYNSIARIFSTELVGRI